MQLGPGSLPGPNFFPQGERNRRLGGVYQIESGLEGGGCRLSPQRNFSFAPLGNPIAPSSVTFGDSFPPRGSLWVVLPYTKKASQIRVRRWAPKQPPYRNTAPHHAKTSEWQRAGHKKRGSRGLAPGALSSGFLRRKPGSRLPAFSGESRAPARSRAGTHVAGLDLRRSQRNRLPTTGPHLHQENFPARRRGKKVQSCFDRLCRAKHTAQPPVCPQGARSGCIPQFWEGFIARQNTHRPRTLPCRTKRKPRLPLPKFYL